MAKDQKEKKETLFFKMFSRFTKIIVSITIIYSMILTTVSYIWAYLDKDPLIDLSSTIVSTLVAPVITYLITNMVQTIFEYNKLAFSTPLSRLEQEDAMNVVKENMEDDYDYSCEQEEN